MLRRFVGLCFILFCSILYSQAQDTLHNGIIKGQAEDTLNHMSLKDAKITLTKISDSSFIRRTLANEDGSFSFEQLPLDSFWVRISATGFASMKQKAVLTPTYRIYPLSPFYMGMAGSNLDEVVVVSTPPVTIKEDTTEFNASAFHVKPNSNVEDLIKKMPGIDVDGSGNIKAQGESVTRVYVNGKRFFGDDPKMATQNLPPDVVDKIQVFDALSDQSQFTGFDDGNRVKSINIITKKSAQVGYFGKIIGGGGRELSNSNTGGLYAGGASIHRFKGEQQISLLLQANNNNQQMFTTQDILGTSGRRGGGRGGAGGAFGGGGSGLTRTLAGGLNYRDQWGKNTSAYGSYFYNNQNTTNGSNALKQMFYSDTSLNNTQNVISNSVNKNQNHRIQFNIETTLDSLNSIIFRPNFSTQNTDITNSSNTDIYKDVNGVRNYISRTNSNTYSHNNGYNGNLDLLFRHKFAKAGRTFSADVSWTGSSNDGHGSNFNISNIAKENRKDTINQQYSSESKSNALSTTLTYTEPIAKYQLLQLAYNHSYSYSNSKRNTYNFDSTTMEYSTPNALLTNAFENKYSSDRATLSYLFNNSKINFSIGTGVQFGRQESINTSKNYDIVRNYTNMYPSANFRYVITKTSNIRFNYQGRTSQPSVSQLQPLTDNSDPLNINTGNPDLKQSFSHSFRILYNDFNRQKNTNMFATINFSTTQNAIVNRVTLLANGGQSTKPVNLSGNYNLNGYFNYGFPINSPKSNLNFSTNIGISKTPGLMIDSTQRSSLLLDTLHTNSYSYSFGETFKWTTNLDSLFDINIFTTPAYTINKYTNQSQKANNYFSQAIAVEASWYTHSGWMVSNNFTYTYYRGIVNTSIPLWNISLSKQVLKDKRGEIRFSVNDLLNKNQGISQSTSATSIQQTTNLVLKRYAQLTFTYNIRNFAKQNQGGRMPGFFGGDRGRYEGGGFGGGHGRMN